MATAVFLGFPGHGHVIPSLPIVAELVRRGDRVIYFVTEKFKDAVEQTGATFRAYGAEFPLAHPQTLARFSSGMHSAIPIQLETSEWVLRNLLPDIEAIRPDYVMYDSLCSWGWYVGQALRTPTVSLYPTLVYNHRGRTMESPRARLKNLARRVSQIPVRAHANRLSRRYRIASPVHLAQLMHSEGDLNLVFTSREFQPDADAFDPARFKFVGPAVTPRTDAPAFPFEQLDGRPLILISLGTAYNKQPAFFQTCKDALRKTPHQVVMAIGEQSDLSAHDVPANFILRPMVPQLELLQRAAAFITHGGMNSVNEALYYDVPLVMVPQGADHGWVAGCVQAFGAGIRLDKRTVNAPQLQQAVETILQDPSYRHAAKTIGATLRAAGGPVRAADEIFVLVHAHEAHAEYASKH